LTLGELIEQTAQRLAAAKLHYGHGNDNPGDEAAFLVLRGLGLPFGSDLSRKAEPRRIEPLVQRRIAQRIPAAYLLNEAWLDGVPFYVDRRVIIPRSHIAFLLGDLDARPRRILDLCTGSGCLAILAARAFPEAKVEASDISTAALEVAARNVRRHKLAGRIRLVQSDLFAKLEGTYDLIVSNPPYVSTPAMRQLPREYCYEPGIALVGGSRGVDYVRRIVEALPERLNPRGLLVCEVGENRRAVERAYPRAGFAWPRDEVFIAKRPSASRSAPRRGRA
jgi:ribosomal protein L3 glutamine methyltransferase